MFRKLLNSLTTPAAIVLSAAITFPSFATIVEFETSHGNFKINLHDETTPVTVTNFLSYVNEGSYNATIVMDLFFTELSRTLLFKAADFVLMGI